PRGEPVRAGPAVVADQDAALGTHRERLADGVVGPRRTHRQHCDLAASLLRQLQPLLDPVLVTRVHDQLHTLAHQAVVRTQAAWGVGIRDLLHTDANVHSETLKSIEVECRRSESVLAAPSAGGDCSNPATATL